MVVPARPCRVKHSNPAQCARDFRRPQRSKMQLRTGGLKSYQDSGPIFLIRLQYQMSQLNRTSKRYRQSHRPLFYSGRIPSDPALRRRFRFQVLHHSNQAFHIPRPHTPSSVEARKRRPEGNFCIPLDLS